MSDIICVTYKSYLINGYYKLFFTKSPMFTYRQILSLLSHVYLNSQLYPHTLGYRNINNIISSLSFDDIIIFTDNEEDDTFDNVTELCKQLQSREIKVFRKVGGSMISFRPSHKVLILCSLKSCCHKFGPHRCEEIMLKNSYSGDMEKLIDCRLFPFDQSLLLKDFVKSFMV